MRLNYWPWPDLFTRWRKKDRKANRDRREKQALKALKECRERLDLLVHQGKTQLILLNRIEHLLSAIAHKEPSVRT